MEDSLLEAVFKVTANNKVDGIVNYHINNINNTSDQNMHPN